MFLNPSRLEPSVNFRGTALLGQYTVSPAEVVTGAMDGATDTSTPANDINFPGTIGPGMLNQEALPV